MTLSLALAVRSMARVNALIKQLASAQTLGSVTVICTDKTGTLTENKMLVTRIWAGGESYTVTGNGYEPRGEIVAATGPLAPPEAGERLGPLLRAAALCNNAHLVPPPGPGGEWSVVGDPTEAALLAAAGKAATMTFAGIVMMQVGNVFACRTEETSLFRIGVLGNRLIIWGVLFELVFTCLLIYIPACQPLFGTAPLGWRDWLLFLPFIPLPVLAEEARKALVRRAKRK